MFKIIIKIIKNKDNQIKSYMHINNVAWVWISCLYRLILQSYVGIILTNT